MHTHLSYQELGPLYNIIASWREYTGNYACFVLRAQRAVPLRIIWDFTLLGRSRPGGELDPEHGAVFGVFFLAVFAHNGVLFFLPASP